MIVRKGDLYHTAWKVLTSTPPRPVRLDLLPYVSIRKASDESSHATTNQRAAKQTRKDVVPRKKREIRKGQNTSKQRDQDTVREKDADTPNDEQTESWRVQKKALAEKFGEAGWQPRKRLSPDALDGIRALHAHDPEKYSTANLSTNFQVSPEAIRRILKSKWRPNETELEDREEAMGEKGHEIWDRMEQLGVKPPKKWRLRLREGRVKDTEALSAQFEEDTISADRL